MSPSEPVPPEVTAIAVALVALWQAEGLGGVEAAPAQEPSPWRLSGRRWERPTGYRWS
jgi:hypothetical protein